MPFAVQVSVTAASWFLTIGGSVILLYFIVFFAKRELSAKAFALGCLAGIVFILLGVSGFMGFIRPDGTPPPIERKEPRTK